MNRDYPFLYNGDPRTPLASASYTGPVVLPTSVPNQLKDEPGTRYDADKSRVDLIRPEFILALGEHYGMGAKKYSDRNWEKGMSWSRCIASALRHLLKFAAGQDYEIEVIDGVEYKIPHVIAAAWNCAALHYYMTKHRDKDDRPF